MMAFCDNPKCRWHNCNGELTLIQYVENGTKMKVENNEYADCLTGKQIRRFFCDDCAELVGKAEKRLRYMKNCYPKAYAGYLNDHGNNLLIHFVQSEWFARESENKKSPF